MKRSLIGCVRPALFATLVASCIALPAAARAPADAPLPGNSVYRIGATLSDQQGQSFTLAARRGHPVLVSMFYNSCQFVCPMLIDTVRMTTDSLSPREKAELSTLLITFDPARDDVAALRKVAEQRGLDPAGWTLARTDAASVRKIAAALDIQYRLLSNGEYNHTTMLVLLDRDGKVVGRSKKMGAVDPAFVKLIHSTLAAGEHAGVN